MALQIFVEFSNIRRHENSFSCSRTPSRIQINVAQATANLTGETQNSEGAHKIKQEFLRSELLSSGVVTVGRD
jgi:hypothetical protein